MIGGLTPLIASSLIAVSGLNTAPAIYMILAAFGAVVALGFVPDRSRVALRL